MSHYRDMVARFDELIERLEGLQSSIAGETAQLANLKANIVNQVLYSGTVQFPAAAADETATVVAIEFAAVSGVVSIDNHTAETITVQDGPGGNADAPPMGIGVHKCRGYNANSWPISSRGTITLWGTPGGLCDVVISANASPSAGVA